MDSTRTTLLEDLGIHNLRNMYWNLNKAELVEKIITNQEGVLSKSGAVLVNTGHHTGRSPEDKFIVNGSSLDPEIWWGKVNKPFSPSAFDRLFGKLKAYMQQKDFYITHLSAGALPDYQIPLRIVTENAWHNLFSRDLFIRKPALNSDNKQPEFTIISCPGFLANPTEDETRSSTFIILNLERKLVLIGGTSYAGEIKKSVFTLMNFLLPRRGVLSMHCSANIGINADVALFFGLSGTGKTTLSSDPDRKLIGDDEHGWSPEGIFNFEGGCYAKTIRLRKDWEPLIWEATHRFGSVLENVVYDPSSREIDFDDERITENTRAAYPIEFIPNHVPAGYGGHPRNIFFLTADAFGVMPPIALLTPDQAMYYFLSGYTSKLAGTEKGLGKEPQATFSACFGAPFLPLPPSKYAELLGKYIAEHKTQVWLINTGWTGGPYGIGSRIKLPFTRAMIRSALDSSLNASAMRKDPHFGLAIPTHCPGVPDEILDPGSTWSNINDYQIQANKLIERFRDNFSQNNYKVSSSVIAAGPGSH
jgi:phosphoenolpyruvate carboxykinase (ATP)